MLGWQQRPLITTVVTLAAWRRPEKARLTLILLATGRGINKKFLGPWLQVLEEGAGNIFYFNEHSTKLFPSAIEPKLQSVHTYVGHPVLLLFLGAEEVHQVNYPARLFPYP